MEGVKEIVVDLKNGKTIVTIVTHYFSQAEVETLLGDASLANDILGWKTTCSFETLVTDMVTHDLKNAERESLIRKHGLDIASPSIDTVG